VIAIAVLFGTAVWLQHVRERAFPAPEIDEQAVYITSPKTISRFALEYQLLAADVYWIRALQYFGGIRRDLKANTAMAAGRSAYAGLYPLLDITTSLDPGFAIAYRFGAIFLAETPPGGPGRPDLAVALLEKGLRERPDKWEYMQDIGFVHYWWRHDYRAAADWFERAGKVPGAPWWLKSMAAVTAVRGGDRATSRAMWEAIRQSAAIDWLRSNAEWRLAQLRALDDIDQLQAILDRYAARTHQPVTDWSPLVRPGLLRSVPADPTGTPYEIDPRGRVTVAVSSPLWPLPAEPQQSDARPPA
jgi:hypothetical protein